MLQAFVEEYEELDVEPWADTLAQRPAVGWDIEFFCLELPNSAYLRAFQTTRETVLVNFQFADLDEADLLPTFDEITASIECDLEPATSRS